MPFAAAAGAAALATAGSSIAGSVEAGNAAGQEKNALQQSILLQQQQSAQNQANFAPFIGVGQNSANAFNADLGQLTTPFNPTLQQLQQTPGYQFELQQGTNATNNSMAAQGLSGSGAELGALDQYSQGLANSTYQSLADIYNQNRSTTANILGQGLQTGEGAASELGNINAGLTGQTSQSLAGIGQAEAGGSAGTANAISGGLSGIGSDASQLAILQKLTNDENSGANQQFVGGTVSSPALTGAIFSPGI
jgi:hypothetical protein